MEVSGGKDGIVHQAQLQQPGHLHSALGMAKFNVWMGAGLLVTLCLNLSICPYRDNTVLPHWGCEANCWLRFVKCFQIL